MNYRTVIFLLLPIAIYGQSNVCMDPGGCADKVRDNVAHSCELGLLEETRCRLLTLEKAAKTAELEEQNKNLVERLDRLANEVADIKSKIPPDGWQNLHCESGDFEATGFPKPPKYPVRKHITFKKPFAKVPAISYGITFIDADQRFNVRSEIYMENLRRTGFTFVMRNIFDTHLYGIRGVWMACPSN